MRTSYTIHARRTHTEMDANNEGSIWLHVLWAIKQFPPLPIFCPASIFGHYICDNNQTNLLYNASRCNFHLILVFHCWHVAITVFSTMYIIVNDLFAQQISTAAHTAPINKCITTHVPIPKRYISASSSSMGNIHKLTLNSRRFWFIFITTGPPIKVLMGPSPENPEQ